MVIESMRAEVVIPEIPFADYILKSLSAKRDRVALIHAPTGREVTLGDVADKAVRCASALFKTGLRKGDLVAICATNSPEIFVVTIAVAACGGSITTCNPFYTEGEIRRQFEHCEPKMVFCVPENLQKLQKIASFVPSVKQIYTIGKAQGADSYESLLQNETDNAFPHIEFDVHEDLLFLLYSSGTTGLPKGVMITHYSFISGLTVTKVSCPLLSDCQYSCMPLFHAAGIVAGFKMLDQGLKHVLDNRFDLKRMFSLIEKYKVTMIKGVPPILLAMDKSPSLKRYDLSSLRSIWSGAAPLAPKLADSLSKKIGCNITQAWGLTECGPLTMTTPGVTPFASVGSVFPNTKLKVIDIVTGKELGPHQNGELCVKGPQVSKGYFKNREATSATFDADGWMHTGDIGHYDNNEMIYIVDRLKELIKYKGFQVAPAEIESVLISHPKIADAAVVGIPDLEAGEIVKAFIVKKDHSLTADEVNDFVEGKLAKYKRLLGGIQFCSAIPKTPSGKILRRELRKMSPKSKM